MASAQFNTRIDWVALPWETPLLFVTCKLIGSFPFLKTLVYSDYLLDIYSQNQVHLLLLV